MLIFHVIQIFGTTFCSRVCDPSKQARKESVLSEARLEVAYESEQAAVKLSKLKRRFIDNVQVLEVLHAQLFVKICMYNTYVGNQNAVAMVLLFCSSGSSDCIERKCSMCIKYHCHCMTATTM
jgi:hypothetical protein